MMSLISIEKRKLEFTSVMTFGYYLCYFVYQIIFRIGRNFIYFLKAYIYIYNIINVFLLTLFGLGFLGLLRPGGIKLFFDLELLWI